MLRELPSWFLAAAGLLAGGATGSFAACTWWRLPRGISLWGASRCPGCQRPVPPWLNLPVLGWLLLRGRAHCCGVRLSPAYLGWEAGCAATGAALGLLVGLWVLMLPLLAAGIGWALQTKTVQPVEPPRPMIVAPAVSGTPEARQPSRWAPVLALGILVGLCLGWSLGRNRQR